MTDASPVEDPRIDAVLDCLGLGDAELVGTETRATDTRVWCVRFDGKTLAVRMFREEQRDVMQAELAALSVAAQAGVPVPGVVAHDLIDGRNPAMAIDWVPGEIIGETLLNHPRLAPRLGWNAGLTLAKMHDIPISHSNESTAIGTDWMSLGAPPGSELRDTIERVASRQSSLLHLDYHPFNILSTGSRISGVIDWTNTMIGDPRADIARTVAIMRLVAPALVGRRGARRMSLGLFTRGLLAGYLAKRGPLEDMPAFYAWAGQMLLRDIGPKLEILVPNPAQVQRKIDDWNTHWSSLALTCEPR